VVTAPSGNAAKFPRSPLGIEHVKSNCEGLLIRILLEAKLKLAVFGMNRRPSRTGQSSQR
jgi:hypothetical protein